MEQLPVTADEMEEKEIPAFAFSFAKESMWTAMGTFDILDLRLHGRAAHDRLTGRDPDPRVSKVQLNKLFETWRKLVPYYKDRGRFGLFDFPAIDGPNEKGPDDSAVSVWMTEYAS